MLGHLLAVLGQSLILLDKSVLLDASAKVFVVSLPGGMLFGLKLSSWQPNKLRKIFTNHRREVDVHDKHSVVANPRTMS